MSSAQTYWRKGWKIGEGSRKIHAHRALIESGERAFRRHTGGWDTNSPGSAVSAVRRMDAALDFGVQKAFSSASDDLEARIARELAGSFGWKVPHATNEVDAFYSRFMDELGILTTREHNQREVSSVREKLNRTVGAIKAFGYNGLFFLATGIGGLIYNLGLMNSQYRYQFRDAEGMANLSALIAVGGAVLIGFAIKAARPWIKERKELRKLNEAITAEESITPAIDLTREKLDLATQNNPREGDLTRDLYLWVRYGTVRLHLYERE